jgi:hypothetical protein
MMLAAGLGCLLCYVLNAAAAASERPKYTDAAGVSLLLCVSFGVTNALVWAYGYPDAILFFPFFDAVFTWMVWRAWRRSKAVWKLAVAGLLVAQLAMHVSLILSWHNGALNHAGLINYIRMINIDFALQLFIVGSVGVAYWLSRVFDSLSAVRGDFARADVRWRR